MADPIQLLSYKELAEATGVPTNTLYQWFKRGKMPSPDFHVGQSPAWLPATVEDWIQDNRRAPAPRGT